MKTRLVKKRRPLSPRWALAAFLLLLGAYLRIARPALDAWRSQRTPVETAVIQDDAPASAERITREVALDALRVYLVQLGAYDSADLARVEAARYVNRGAAGFVYEGMRVIGAVYDAEADARRVIEQLKAQEGLTAQMLPVASPALTLRVTAAQAQIEALEGAEQALREVATALGALSFSLDRGEVPLAQAVQTVETLAARLEAARETLSASVGSRESGIAQNYVALLGRAAAALRNLSAENTSSVLAFSSKMKYNTIELRLNHIDLIEEMI